MWVEKRTVKGQTRYHFYERFKNPLTGKYQRVVVTFEKKNRQTTKEANRLLQEKIGKALNSLKHHDSNIRLSELVDEFVPFYYKKVTYGTAHAVENGLYLFARQFGQDAIVSNITSFMLNDYFDKRLYNPKNPLTNGGLQNIKGYVSLLFNYALQHGYISSNPMNDVHVSWRSETQKRRDEIENKYLTDDEYLKIIDDFRNYQKRNDVADLLEWLYYTGMRFSEGAAIQVKDIYVDKLGNSTQWFAKIHGSMVVRRGAPQGQRYIKSSSPKTTAGFRDVILPKQAVLIYQRNSENKLPDDFVFLNMRKDRPGYGLPFRLNAINKLLKNAVKRTGINKNVTTHFFRHTHVSKLAELGVPLYVIQKRVGHASSDITKRVYLHVTSRVEESVAQKLTTNERCSRLVA